MKHFLKNKGKRLTAAVLSAVMCLMALPMSAFAFTAEEGKSVEAYYQEAGRAGRDGEKAHCILLYGGGDVSTARFLIEHSHDNEVLEEAERRAAMARDYARLEAMTGYCKTTGCLRGYLLDYFGQPHPDRCGNCGGCAGPRWSSPA